MRKQQGFTLIEVMIVVIIVAILGSIAYPAYTHHVRKAKRADGMTALLQVQLAQEKWRANNPQYTSSLSDLGLSATSADGHYAIRIDPDTVSAVSYTVTASGTGTQANDTGCTQLTLAVRAGGEARGPDGCW
jgi:type IV pilus assembly protein PilE